jgi:methylated-DNA-[protein]-cysteine S-methyltransferase
MTNWTVVEGVLADGLAMRLYLAERDGKLWRAKLCDDDHPLSEDEFASAQVPTRGGDSDVLNLAAVQVTDYFAGLRLTFELPLALDGTPFQIRVWQELTRIPFGATLSYGDIAQRIGRPTACRAVGAANGRNHLPLIVPCHRVIAADGKLCGFTGGLGLKKRLLAHETAVLSRMDVRAASNALCA